MTEVTPDLDDFLALYQEDDNHWWTMGCGHHQNLFEAAVERIKELEVKFDDELRAPDPTLTALSGQVYAEVGGPGPVVAHREDDSGDGFYQPACLTVRYDTVTVDAAHARWFAVPCRECFPAAPAAGHPATCDGGPVCPGEPHPHLAWQVKDG